MKKNPSAYRDLLIAERRRLRKVLSELGHVHPDDQYDFDASAEESPLPVGDEADHAAQIEEFSSRVILEAELEKRYQEIRAALEALEEGTYGICVVCKKEIPAERLEVNPAARTCVEHVDAINEQTSRI